MRSPLPSIEAEAMPTPAGPVAPVLLAIPAIPCGPVAPVGPLGIIFIIGSVTAADALAIPLEKRVRALVTGVHVNPSLLYISE